MSILLATLFLLTIFILGWLISTAAGVQAFLERLGLSFLLGSWVMTLLMMAGYQVFDRFDQPLTFAATLLPSFLLVVIFHRSVIRELKADGLQIFEYFRHLRVSLIQTWKKLTQLEKVILALISAMLLSTGLSNLTWPVNDWDSVALYDFRALLIKMVGNWHDGKKLGYFYQYPPFTSLLHGSLYLFGFERVKIFYSLLFVSFLVVFYFFLRKHVNRVKGLIGVLLLTFAPLVAGHITIAYTNLPYTIYFALSVLYAWEWLRNKQEKDLLLSFFLTCGAFWIRQSEPFWVIVLLILVVGQILKRPAQLKSWLLFTLGIGLFAGLYKYWPLYVQSLQLPPPPASANVTEGVLEPINLGSILRHTFQVSDYLIKNMINPLYLLLLPFSIFVLFDRQAFKKVAVKIGVITVLLMAGIIIAGTYYFSFTYASWTAIGESLTRLVMIFVPLLIYLIMQSSFWQMLFQFDYYLPKDSKTKIRTKRRK